MPNDDNQYKLIIGNNFKNEEEKLISILFNKLDFNKKGSNVELKKLSNDIIGEIDLVYEFEENIFFIEVTKQKDKIHEKMAHWFSRWSYNFYSSMILRKMNIPENYKIYKIFIDLAHYSNEDDAIGSIKQYTDQKDNIILYKSDIEYFNEEIEQIGKITRNDLLSLINVNRKRLNKKIPALQFYIDDIKAYSFIARVDELLETCYIKRRYKKDEGYQRAINYAKIKSITKDIKSKRIVAFPNSIIVNSDYQLCKDNILKSDIPARVDVDLPLKYCELKIIDGQHRLLGFCNVGETIIKSTFLPVIAFENMSHQKELKMFVDINSKQKKVDPNLVLLLKNDYEWSTEENEYYEKIAVHVILEISKTKPLKDKIYLGTVKEKKKGNISLYTLVNILLNNGFIKKNNALWQLRSDDIVTPLSNMQSLIKKIDEELNEVTNKNQPFFFQNTGLRMIFRFIKIMENNRQNRRINIKNDEIIKDVATIFINKPTVLQELQKSYGEGGASDSALFLCKELKRGFPDKYIDLETDLQKIPFIRKKKQRSV